MAVDTLGHLLARHVTAAAVEGIKFEVLKRSDVKARLRASAGGYGLSREPFACANHCLRLAKDYERYTMTLAEFPE